MLTLSVASRFRWCCFFPRRCYHCHILLFPLLFVCFVLNQCTHFSHSPTATLVQRTTPSTPLSGLTRGIRIVKLVTYLTLGGGAWEGVLMPTSPQEVVTPRELVKGSCPTEVVLCFPLGMSNCQGSVGSCQRVLSDRSCQGSVCDRVTTPRGGGVADL